MKIGIDIDNTITTTLPVLKEYCENYNEKVVKRGLKIHEDGFATYNLFDWTLDEEMEFCNKYLAKVLLSAEIKKDAAKIIKKLKDENNYIYIITARKEPQILNPYELTKDFLDKAGIEYNKLIVGCQNKCSFCIENDINLMLDDEPHNIEKISKYIPVIAFDEIYNSTYNNDNVYKVKTWKEIYTIYKNM